MTLDPSSVLEMSDLLRDRHHRNISEDCPESFRIFCPTSPEVLDPLSDRHYRKFSFVLEPVRTRIGCAALLFCGKGNINTEENYGYLRNELIIPCLRFNDAHAP